MILLIDDDLTHQMMLTSLLKKLGYGTAYASNGKDALYSLEKKKRKFIDLVLLDLNMPEVNGLDILAIMKQRYPDLPVIMITGSDDIKDAVQAMKLGAVDFITKPVEPEHLKIAVSNAIRIGSMGRELARLKRKEEKSLKFDDIIGAGTGLAKVINIARKAVESDIPVLINGETGVGKELLALAIHGESKRAGQPFVEVNCASIPNNILEGQLFGHDNVIGKFQEADGGTISLYEVGELSPSAQARLLKFLQQKEIQPLNGNVSVHVDVRIISSSSKNLASAVKQGNFREDLFFRLNVLNIDIPPLRERIEDISELAHYFIRNFAASENLPTKTISKQAEHFLISYEWRGNVRELKNIIHRTMLLCESDVMDVQDFACAISDKININNDIRSTPYTINLLKADGNLKNMDDIEQEAIRISLEHNNHNITRAAKSLGIAKSTFYKKMSMLQRNSDNYTVL